jgi:hypothetical protein
MDDPNPDQAIIVELARYLRANPLACDTLEGIAHWWLHTPNLPPDRLARALARMESAGVVARLHAADGQLRFRRAELNAAVDAGLDQLMKERP